MTLAPLGIFGGTFNPIHYGHLNSALELKSRLNLGELRLMPSALPPHRDEPECSAAERADMVALALQGSAGLVCDDRELRRKGPSYSYDSLAEIRAEEGDRSVCMVMGVDAVSRLARWYRWKELSDLAHLVIMARPGWEMPTVGEVARWLEPRMVSATGALAEQPAGLACVLQLTPYPVSSTEVRARFAAGDLPRDLLPEAVWQYIRKHGLYGLND